MSSLAHHSFVWPRNCSIPNGELSKKRCPEVDEGLWSKVSVLRVLSDRHKRHLQLQPGPTIRKRWAVGLRWLGWGALDIKKELQIALKIFKIFMRGNYSSESASFRLSEKGIGHIGPYKFCLINFFLKFCPSIFLLLKAARYGNRTEPTAQLASSLLRARYRKESCSRWTRLVFP